jgi:hypothetical protein
MSKKWVRRFLGFALVFNIVAIALMVVVMFGGGALLQAGFAYLFVPWLPMGTFSLPLLAVAIVLSVGVSLWRSRVSAVLLLVVYLASKLLLAPWMYVLGPAGLTLWFTFAVVWALCIATGVIGTIGYYRLPSAERTPRSRGATIVGAAVSAVLVLGLLAVGAQQYSVTAAQFATHTIEYRATSSGDAHVRYSSKSFGEAEADFTKTWSKQISMEGSQDRITLDVAATGDAQATVSCAILWDGKVLHQNEQSGVLAKVSCLAEQE